MNKKNESNERKIIEEMIDNSRKNGFSAMFSGKNEEDCEKNFYLSLGLDEKGNFRK